MKSAVDIDLYAVLGVPRHADAAAIQQAYRRAAMEAHPDHGGSAEKFATLKRAYDVLKDLDRRAHYDATGAVDEKKDRVDEEALAAIGQALQSIIQSSDPFEKSPMLVRITERFAELRNHCNEQINDLKRQKKRAEKMQKRLSRKGDGSNVLARMIDHMVLSLDKAESQRNLEHSIIMRAIEILGDHDFKMDEAKPEAAKTKSPGLFATYDIISPTTSGA